MNKRKTIILAVLMCSLFSASAQYIDNFDGAGTPDGWSFRTGDGTATINFNNTMELRQYTLMLLPINSVSGGLSFIIQ